MKGKVQKELRNQKKYAQYELNRLKLKMVQRDAKSSWHERTRAMLELAELPRNSSSTRLQNRCVLTGRSGGVLRQFKMSRIKFRELAELSILPGVKKSSW